MKCGQNFFYTTVQDKRVSHWNMWEVLITYGGQQGGVTFVIPRTMSMDVVRGLMEPTSLQPTT